MGSPETDVNFFTWLQIPAVWKILLFILRENEWMRFLGAAFSQYRSFFATSYPSSCSAWRKACCQGPTGWTLGLQHSHPTRVLLGLHRLWAGKAAAVPVFSGQVLLSGSAATVQDTVSLRRSVKLRVDECFTPLGFRRCLKSDNKTCNHSELGFFPFFLFPPPEFSQKTA